MISDVILTEEKSMFDPIKKQRVYQINISAQFYPSEHEKYECLLILSKKSRNGQWELEDFCLKNIETNRYESVSTLYSPLLLDNVLNLALKQVFDEVVA